MSSKTRYIELDLLRSLAVIGMILYHAAYDLQIFYRWPLDVSIGPWKIFEQIVAITFLLLMGISFAISYDRTESSKRYRKFLKRGFIIIGCGCLVSIATYIVDPETYVRFGILQLIGVSILLLPLFVRFRSWNLLVACFILMIHQWATHILATNNLLLPFGIISPRFQTVDYFPLIPWFAVILSGLVIGQTFYIRFLSWRSYLPKIFLTLSSTSAFTFPGRYALIIYLLHQPILVAIMHLMGDRLI